MTPIPNPAFAAKATNVSAASTQLSTKEVESAIASINANQIAGIAKHLIGDVMDRLSIDIQQTDILKHIVQNDFGFKGTSWACAKYYDSDSKLMKILLPIFIEQITKSFSIPSEFAKNGIVFDLLNKDKKGLLDHVEDQFLQKRISEGMRHRSTFYVTLKADKIEGGKL